MNTIDDIYIQQETGINLYEGMTYKHPEKHLFPKKISDITQQINVYQNHPTKQKIISTLIIVGCLVASFAIAAFAVWFVIFMIKGTYAAGLVISISYAKAKAVEGGILGIFISCFALIPIIPMGCAVLQNIRILAGKHLVKLEKQKLKLEAETKIGQMDIQKLIHNASTARAAMVNANVKYQGILDSPPSASNESAKILYNFGMEALSPKNQKNKEHIQTLSAIIKKYKKLYTPVQV